MTIERISIEWRPINATGGTAGHLYLVAREAGQNDGEGNAISIGPSIPFDADDPFGGAYSILFDYDYGFVEVNESNGAGSALGTF
ncbi:MAG: hypothetical protein H6867_00305 [Rhodospirillales bacterium]|nr:hypothetical protein [Rhodospirillales bacterium]MCB9996900.1 hypothetical protein [Rhodospirillales bacterium]